MTIVGTILVVLATIGLGLLADRKWDLLPRKDKLLAHGKPVPALPGHAAGEAPATAIPASPGEIERLRRARCVACDKPTDALADDRVHYDGSELLVVRARCTRCGHARAIYVRPT